MPPSVVAGPRPTPSGVVGAPVGYDGTTSRRPDRFRLSIFVRIVGNFPIEEVDLEEVGLLMMGLFRPKEENIHGDGR